MMRMKLELLGRYALCEIHVHWGKKSQKCSWKRQKEITKNKNKKRTTVGVFFKTLIWIMFYPIFVFLYFHRVPYFTEAVFSRQGVQPALTAWMWKKVSSSGDYGKTDILNRKAHCRRAKLLTSSKAFRDNLPTRAGQMRKIYIMIIPNTDMVWRYIKLYILLSVVHWISMQYQTLHLLLIVHTGDLCSTNCQGFAAVPHVTLQCFTGS